MTDHCHKIFTCDNIYQCVTYVHHNYFMNLLFLCSILLIALSSLQQDPVVNTTNGKLTGKQLKTKKNNTYYAFKNVPFGKPPVGRLRFQAPKPAEKWNGTRNYTQGEIMCYQTYLLFQSTTYSDLKESEDCLYLNIYTPKLSGNKTKPTLPTLFYIYGGAFQMGSGTEHKYGPSFFLDEDIIVVTINYRVGVLGFLSTGDEVIPGNAGLKDQLLALKWVHKNINQFGGDPNKITICGQSAGGVSVTYLLLNKESKHLIRGAICQSGTVLNHWTKQIKPKENAYIFGKKMIKEFSCKNTSKDLKEALLHAKPEDIVYYTDNKNITFVPVREAPNAGAFITENVYDLLKNKRATKVPIIIGFNSEEVLSFKILNYAMYFLIKRYNKDVTLWIPNSMHLKCGVNKTLIGSLIREMYLDNDEKLEDNYGAFIKYLSDTVFNIGILKFAELYSKITKYVYFYQFSYDGPMGGSFKKYENAERVGHSAELRYMWNQNLKDFDNNNPEKFHEKDLNNQKRLVQFWSNFVKYQNPTPNLNTTEIVWPILHANKSNDLFYLDINEELCVKSNPKEERYLFWNQLFNNYATNFTTF